MRYALSLAFAGFMALPAPAAAPAVDEPAVAVEIGQANPCNPRIRRCR